MITQIKRDQLRDGLITNDKISPSANIVYSKLNLTNSIQGTDLTGNAKETVLEYKLQGYWDKIENFLTSTSSNDNITKEVEQAASTDTHTLDGSAKGVLTTGKGAWGAGIQNYRGQMRLNLNGDPIDDGTNSQVYFELHHENYFPLSGTISWSSGSTTVTGSTGTGGTAFTTELEAGSVLIVNEEVLGTVASITSDTSLELTSAPSTSGTNQAYSRQSAKGTVSVSAGATSVSGTNTKFTTDFEVGDALVSHDTHNTIGYIASIDSDTSMTLESAASEALNGTADKRQYKAYYKKRDGSDFTFSSATAVDMLFIEVYDEYNKPLLASAIGYGFVDVVGVTGTHNHDDRYYTKTQLGSTTDGSSGADLIGFTSLTQSGWSAATTVQQAIENMVADLSDTSANSSGASLVGVEATGNLTSTDVQAALEELQGDIDNLNNTVAGGSLDSAYDNGSVVDVDNTDVDWQLTDGKSFKVSTEDSGNPEIVKISANASGDTVDINADTDIDGKVTPKEISKTVYLSKFNSFQEAVNYLHNTYDGGTLIVDVDEYDISSETPVTLYSNITIQGFKGRQTTIKSTNTSNLHFTATDANNIKLIDLRILGPGQSAAGGGGIYFTKSANANVAHIYMENVIVEECANSGISINTPILSTFINVKAIKCAGHGFNLWNGTSCSFKDCYSITHTQAGFYLSNMTYSELSGCASEACGIAYDIEGGGNISLTACGNEDTLNRSASYPGYAFKITANNVTLNSCYSRDSINTAIYSTGANLVVNAFRDAYTTNNPTYSIDNTGGSSTTIIESSFAKATNFNNVTKIISADIYKASGELKLQDSRTSAIPFSDASNSSFVDGTSTSIIGAINAAYQAAAGANTLDEVYDGETGNRVITQDNGSVEWQITDGYEHDFQDASGNNILAVKALSAGDEVDVVGKLVQSSGQVTFGGNVDAENGLDVTGANLTVGGSNFSVDVSNGDTTIGGNATIGGTLNVTGVATLQNNLVVQGNLTVQGTQTIVNTETIELADNIIVLNSNFTGASPTENAGIEVERGSATNVQLFWDETNDAWAFTDLTGTYYIAKTSGTGGALSLDEAYNGGSVVDVDDTDVDWHLSSGKTFKISPEATGTTPILSVANGATASSISAEAGSTSYSLTSTAADSFKIDTAGGVDIDTDAGLTINDDSGSKFLMDPSGYISLISATGQNVNISGAEGDVHISSTADTKKIWLSSTNAVQSDSILLQSAAGGVKILATDASHGLFTVNVGMIDMDTTGGFTVDDDSGSSIHVAATGVFDITSAKDLTFKDQYLTNSLPLSETGNSGLSSDFTATSIVGALNELKNDVLSIQWKAPVNTYNDLPATGNTDGDIRLVLDTDDIYEWNGATSSWMLVSAGAENWLPSVETKANLPLSGNRDGDVRLVKELGAMYYWDESDSGWKPFETGTAVDTHYAREDYTATAGQTVFNLGHSYQQGKNTLLVFVNGDLKKVSDDYAETNDTTVTFNSGLNAGDKVAFIIGFAPNNFYGEIHSETATEGQTVINLPFEYLVNNDEIEVFKNGLLMLKGSSNDYTESSSTSVTFNTALHAGDIIVVRKARDYTKALNWTGDKATFTATAGQTQFDWSTTEGWTYTNGAHEIEVFKNGLFQFPGTDYTEDGAAGSIQNSITFTSATSAGDKIYIRKAGNYGLSNHNHDLLYTRTADLNSTAHGKGASLIGIEDANNHFTSTNVEGALDELYQNIVGSNTLDEVYDGETGTRIITMDNGSVEWQISSGYQHVFSDASGIDILSVEVGTLGSTVDIDVTNGFTVDDDSGAHIHMTAAGALALGGASNQTTTVESSGTGALILKTVNGQLSIENLNSSNSDAIAIKASVGGIDIDATQGITIDDDSGSYVHLESSGVVNINSHDNMNLSSESNIALTTSAGSITFDDQYLSSAIPISESGVTGLDSKFTATSIVGAINEALNAAEGANTLDEVYDGETGNRIITQDNGSVEWQITDGYEHDFQDASGNDILSVKALATGDEVDITGKLNQSGGQVILAGNVDATSGLDVTGANFTVGGTNFSVDVSNGNTTIGGTATISGDIDISGDATVGGTLNVTGATTLQNNLVVQGNLTVQGTQTIVNTETIELADNIIVLNSNFTGSNPTENAGIEVERGSATNVQLFWDETNDAWAFTDLTGTYFIAKTAGTGGSLSLDEAYNGGSVVDVDDTDVDWQLTDGKSFKISTEDTGNPNILTVSANASGDSVGITADLSVSGDATLTGGLTQSSGQVTFGGNVDANSGVDVTGDLTQSSGQVTFGGNVDANSGVDVTGAFTQSGGAITINGNAASTISTTSANLTVSTTTSGDISIESAGEIKFNDSRTSSAITLSDASNTAFVDGVSTSLIGAINKAYQAAEGANTLDEVYDGETGNRIITMDNGSVEWQISDGYEHDFQDDSGNNILAVKPQATGDIVEITGKLNQSGGAFSLDGNAASTIKTSSGNLTIQSAAELIFTDSRVSNIPFTASGVTGLATTAQNIIGAINEAFQDAIKLGYEEQSPDATEVANDYIVLEETSTTSLLPESSKTMSELRDDGIYMSVYLNGLLLSDYEVSYGYSSGEKRIEFDGTGNNAVQLDTDDVVIVKIIKKAQ